MEGIVGHGRNLLYLDPKKLEKPGHGCQIVQKV